MGKTDDFDGFYAAHYGGTVAMVYGLTADLGAAQDIAQEAFCRAWQRWKQVADYDNPVAWVRRVATNLAHSRWRRIRYAGSRSSLREDWAAPPEPDHVAVVAALRKLPKAQREAIVLHYLVDLPVDEVAEHLEVPVGTVKSWLHRGRGALALDLKVSMVTPPMSDVVARSKKLRRVPAITSAAICMVLLVAGWWVLNRRHQPAPPAQPTPAPSSPSPSVTPLAWNNPLIDASSWRDCPQQPVRSGESTLFVDSGRVQGDLMGDASPEWAVAINCRLEPGTGTDWARLAILSPQPDGSLKVEQWVTDPGGGITVQWIRDRTLYHSSPGSLNVISWRGGNSRNALDEYPARLPLDRTALDVGPTCSAPSPLEVAVGSDDEDLTLQSLPQSWVPGKSPTEPDLVMMLRCRGHRLLLYTVRQGDVWAAVQVLRDMAPGEQVKSISSDGVRIQIAISGGATIDWPISR